MEDRPTAIELIQAVREFLERELVPGVADRGLRYQALIALSVLGIVEREVPEREGRLRAELDALADLLGRARAEPPAEAGRLPALVLEANRELCRRIRAGAADDAPWRERVLAHVRNVVEEKLRISDPERLKTFTAGGGS